VRIRRHQLALLPWRCRPRSTAMVPSPAFLAMQPPSSEVPGGSLLSCMGPLVAPIPAPMVVPPKAPTTPPRVVPSKTPAVEIPWAGLAASLSPAHMVVPSKAPAPARVPHPAFQTRQPPSSEVPDGTHVPDEVPSHTTEAIRPSGAPTSTTSKVPVVTAASPRKSTIAPDTRGTPKEPYKFPEARDPPTERNELDDLVREAVQSLQQYLSWEDFFGRSQSPEKDLHPDIGKLTHRAAHLLSTRCDEVGAMDMSAKARRTPTWSPSVCSPTCCLPPPRVCQHDP
jgi:hypothetical protein